MDKEQLAGTVAILSCTVTGLTQKLDGVKWTKSDDSEITAGNAEGFTIETGDGSFNTNTQTTTLTVPAIQNNIDTTYNCLITSSEHGETDKKTVVNLKVFSK